MTADEPLVAGPAILIALTLGSQAPPDRLATLAKEGWSAARAAAPQGGTPESLAKAKSTLAELDAVSPDGRWRLQVEYAHALIAAAMAASQDENAEMDLYLTHARSLSERLQTSAFPARWPLEIDEAEGELWLEVDRYADAARAYRRAVDLNPHGSAFLGLARSAARSGDLSIACDSYRRVIGGTRDAPADPSAANEAREFLKRCP